MTRAADDRDEARPASQAGDPGGSGPVTPLLDISELAVRFGPVRAVDGVSLRLPRGPCGLGLVGESGSGKSMTTLAVLGLAYTVGATVRGSITLDGTELIGLCLLYTSPSPRDS